MFVAMDVDRETLNLMESLGVEPRRAVLLRFEPRVVSPLNYDARVRLRFAYVFDIGRKAENQNGEFWEYWPQNWPSELNLQGLVQWQDRSERLVLVNANKLSLIKNERYSLRRKLIRSSSIDVFGANWGSSVQTRLKVLLAEFVIACRAGQLPSISAAKYWFANHSRIMGLAGDKLATLARYKYALVVENSPEYISEKLFDAFFAGCMPIYAGPSVRLFDVPASLVFEFNADLDSFSDALESAQQKDREVWLNELDAYLSSSQTFDRWAAPRVFKRLTERILALRPSP